MDIYTDGSRIGLAPNFIIGWASVCNRGLISSGAREGGSNINAEMLAISDCLNKILSYKRKLIENEDIINIITDSKTSIQIISGYLKNPNSYDLNESENYRIADQIASFIKKLKYNNKEVMFTHVDGHEDNLGNNFADFAATQASEQLRKSL